jgi:HAD superfamily hydrolase (TIGR01509 family)
MSKLSYLPPKFIAWDMGDTLIQLKQSAKMTAAQKISAELGAQIDPAAFDQAMRNEWRQREAPRDLDRIRGVKTKRREFSYWISFYGKMLERMGLHAPSDALLVWLADMQSLPQYWQPIDGAVNTVQALHDLGYPQGVISNAFPSAVAILKDLKLWDVFEVVILSYVERTVKPEPDIYLKAARSAGLRPEDMVFIDDRVSFVEGARQAGLRSIWYNQGGMYDGWDGEKITHLSQVKELVEKGR